MLHHLKTRGLHKRPSVEAIHDFRQGQDGKSNVQGHVRDIGRGHWSTVGNHFAEQEPERGNLYEGPIYRVYVQKVILY